MKIGSVDGRAASRFKMSENDRRDALACVVMCKNVWHKNRGIVNPVATRADADSCIGYDLFIVTAMCKCTQGAVRP